MRSFPCLILVELNRSTDMTHLDTDILREVVLANISRRFRFLLPRIPDNDVGYRTRTSHSKTTIDHNRITVLPSIEIDTIRFTGELDGLIALDFSFSSVHFIQVGDIEQTGPKQQQSFIHLKNCEYRHFRGLDIIHCKIGVKQCGEIEGMIIDVVDREFLM